MRFICEKSTLQEAISIVTKAITGKSTMPILEGIYIEANNGTLTLIGSDNDVSIQTQLEATVLEPGKLVIDSKIFSEIIRKLPNADVKIETLENEIVQLSCQKSIFNLVYMNAEDYPSLPKINEDITIGVNQHLLKNMIKGTSFAVALEETRPILQGVLFEIKNSQLNLVALDGYRLATKTEYINYSEDLEIVIPGKTLNEVSKILNDTEDEIQIKFTNNHILFDLKNTTIISRLLDGKFVSYRSLLPQEHKLLVEANRQELQRCIERASLMAKDSTTNLVKLSFEEDNLVITSNSQIGKVREELGINLQGEPIQIAFNSRYVLDVLKNMEQDTVVLKMTSSISPCVIEAKDSSTSRYLVLPVRLVK